ncbi:hypothetical protein [Pseudomonas sp. SDO52101_S400]
MKKFWMMAFLLFATTALAGGDGVSPSMILVDLGKCKFTMNNLYNGSFEVDRGETPGVFLFSKVIKPKAKRPLAVNLKFLCIDPIDSETIAALSGGKVTDKGWVMSLDSDVEANTAMHNTFYVLNGKNWTAPGISQDVTNGEERSRTRGFAFCIPHDSAAICGSGDVAYLDDLKNSALQEVINMVETIDFVE